MIITDKFKSYSLFTADELDESIMHDLENMTDEERAVFFEILQNPNFESDLNAMELDREIVSVTQWLEDDYYMGSIGKSIYQPWKDDLVELFETSQYDTSIVQGGIGCVTGDTLVQMSDGSLREIHLLAKRSGRIIAWDAPQLFYGVENGRKAVHEIAMGNGFKIKATAEHKWMTQDGWTQTSDLRPGHHRIRSPRYIKTVPIVFDVSIAEAEWAGIFISAGKLHRTAVKGVAKYLFIKTDPQKLKVFTDLCREIGIPVNEPQHSYVSLLEKDLQPIFAKLRINDPIKQKLIPNPILQSSNEVLAGFIRGALISCSYGGLDNYQNSAIRSYSQQEPFLKHMVLALKRFGVRARLSTGQSGKTLGYLISINGRTNLLEFAAQISFIMPDIKVRFNAMMEIMKAKTERSHADMLPITYGDALAWVKRHNISIGKTKYAKWCTRDNAHHQVSHPDLNLFFKLWPHMMAHAYEIFYSDDTLWEEIRSVKSLDRMEDVYDLIVPDDNSYLANGMLSHNSGKSTFSHLCVLRMVYEASCLKNPCVSYGLSPNSIIGFCTLAKSKETARRVVFEQIASKIQESPYFKYEFPPVKDLKDEILFPKGLSIISGSSTDTSIIGMNIFGGIIDEVNFWGRVKKSNMNFGREWGSESKAGRLFESVRRRMKSRYIKKGKLPGILMLISSKTTKDSFTEQLIRKEQALGNKGTFVRDRSILEVKRASFTDKSFRVLVGTVDYVSRILIDGEDVSHMKDAIVIDVPDDFRGDFENNIEEALRDIAGISTIAISNFISKVETINQMIDPDRSHPFQCPMMPDPNIWDSVHSYNINWYALCNRKANGEWVPKLNPEAPRHVAFDPAFTGDAFGMAIAHVAGMVPVQKHGDIIEYQPHFVVDFVLAIQGSKEQEVVFRNVRELTYEFSNHGFHLAEFSMDTYQSREMAQALEQQGYKAGIYSVDTGISSKGENVVNTAIGKIPKSKQAYWYFRSAIYEGRVKCYDYPILFRELRRLENTPEKVDHPEGESKDLADAVCGVIWTLFRSKHSGEFLAPSKGILVNPRPDQETMGDYQESITDRYHNTIDVETTVSAEVLELKGTKVYQKTKPKSVSPKYQKITADGAVEDLRYSVDDYMQR